MVNYNFPRRIATKTENIIMKPFYFIEQKVDEDSGIEPFGFIWNLIHWPSKAHIWVHFHIIRRDQLEEHLREEQELNEYLDKVTVELEEAWRAADEYISNN